MARTGLRPGAVTRMPSCGQTKADAASSPFLEGVSSGVSVAIRWLAQPNGVMPTDLEHKIPGVLPRHLLAAQKEPAQNAQLRLADRITRDAGSMAFVYARAAVLAT